MGTTPDHPSRGKNEGEAPVEARDPPPATLAPLSEVFAEIMATVPDEELARLPPDWSENHDHYLYGAPRKQ